VVSFPASYPLPPVLLQPVMQALIFLASIFSPRLLSALSFDCLLRRHTSLYFQIMVYAFAPLVLVSLLGLALLLGWLGWRRQRRAAEGQPFHEEETGEGAGVMGTLAASHRSGVVLRLGSFVLVLSFIPVIELLSGFFLCTAVDGAWYLSADFTQQCYADEWYTLLPGMVALALL
jgi:hypothetical protein